MKKFLMYLYVFFITLAVFSANWAINGFAFLNFDETFSGILNISSEFAKKRENIEIYPEPEKL